MTTPAIDVTVTGGGSVYLFVLLTPAARDWVDEHVSEDRQTFGGGVAVEWQFAAGLAEGMLVDGLVMDTTEVQR